MLHLLLPPLLLLLLSALPSRPGRVCYGHDHRPLLIRVLSCPEALRPRPGANPTVWKLSPLWPSRSQLPTKALPPSLLTRAVPWPPSCPLRRFCPAPGGLISLHGLLHSHPLRPGTLSRDLHLPPYPARPTMHVQFHTGHLLPVLPKSSDALICEAAPFSWFFPALVSWLPRSPPSSFPLWLEAPSCSYSPQCKRHVSPGNSAPAGPLPAHHQHQGP